MSRRPARRYLHGPSDLSVRRSHAAGAQRRHASARGYVLASRHYGGWPDTVLAVARVTVLGDLGAVSGSCFAVLVAAHAVLLRVHPVQGRFLPRISGGVTTAGGTIAGAEQIGAVRRSPVAVEPPCRRSTAELLRSAPAGSPARRSALSRQSAAASRSSACRSRRSAARSALPARRSSWSTSTSCSTDSASRTSPTTSRRSATLSRLSAFHRARPLRRRGRRWRRHAGRPFVHARRWRLPCPDASTQHGHLEVGSNAEGDRRGH